MGVNLSLVDNGRPSDTEEESKGKNLVLPTPYNTDKTYPFKRRPVVLVTFFLPPCLDYSGRRV